MSRNSELRAHREELQRVQIGLVGLAAVLLIVTLANLVVDAARQDGGAETVAAGTELSVGAMGSTGANVSSSVKGPGNEPLADLGVTPATPDALPILPSPVPDLEPDPQLRQRMDQDPGQTQQPR